MNALAWIIIGAYALGFFMPGGVFKGKPELNWENGQPQLAILRGVGGLALAIWIVVT